MEKKAFYKFQHPFMIKTVNKLSIEGMHTNIKKPYMTSSQLTSYSIMGEKKITFLLKSRIRQECPFSLLLFNTTLSLARAIRQETEIKGIQVGK